MMLILGAQLVRFCQFLMLYVQTALRVIKYTNQV
jgi:hypothetical protein